MDMEALELFLAESTAVAVVGEFDALGSMASALNKRHKVRHVDLSNLFDMAAAQGPNTYERAILMSYLLVFGGGAYQNPEAILQAADLNALKVQPHWASNAAHNFNSVCLWEPMNLWAGWANENQSNNTTVIDPHMLNFFSNGTLVYTDVTPQTTKTTPNMTLAGTFLPGVTAQTTWPAYPGVPQRRLSAHSAMLVQHQSFIENELKHLGQQAQPTVDSTLSREELKRYLKNLTILETRSTTAGEQHYHELLGSLVARRLDTLACYKLIDDARQAWIRNRAALRMMIDRFVNCLERDLNAGGAFYKPKSDTSTRGTKRPRVN